MFLKAVLKKAIFAFIYLLFALGLELITFSMLGLGIPGYLLLDISILFFLAAILFVIPGIKGQIVFSGIFLFLQGALGFVNSVLNKIDGSFFSIAMLKVQEEGLAAFDFSFIDIKFTLTITGFIILALLAIILINKFLKVKVDFKAGFALMLVSICLVTQFLSFGLFKLQLSNLYAAAGNEGNVFFDDNLLYDTLEIKREALKKFGSFGFYFKDLQNSLAVNKVNPNDIEKLKNYLSAGNNKSVNSRFNGISSGNNVIIIMCESLEWYAMSRELTPNLYKLVSKNIYNDKFYSNNKTNVSEGLGFLGSYPKMAAFSKDYEGLESNNAAFTAPFSLPNILKPSYTSKFFHNFDGGFYGRSLTHKNVFGFDGFIDLYEMTNETRFGKNALKYGNGFGDWASDFEMFKACANEIAPDDGSKFFSFITTVAMHGPYDRNLRLQSYVNKISSLGFNDKLPGIDKNIDLLKFSDTQKERLINYTAAAMDLDEAVGVLMDRLNNTGLIDNTTVILYSDHWAYYQELNYLVKNISDKELYNPELYRIPFIIVDKKLQKAINTNSQSYNINSYMSAHDIMPTVLDLLGYTFNNKIYLGKSVFLENPPYSCFISHQSGYFNDKLFTYNGSEFLYEDKTVTKKEKEDFSNYLVDFVNKQNYMDLIYLLKDTNTEFSFDGIFIAEKIKG